ncbi:serine hydrolase domain-containing protein [Actinopolymorpha pittospori]
MYDLRCPSRRDFLRTAVGSTVALGAVAAGAAPALADTDTRTDPTHLPEEALRSPLEAITAEGMFGTFSQVRAGRQTWRGASGVADFTTGQLVRPGFQHRIGSITKTFVATAMLQLVGEGRLSLDGPVGRYLPEFDPAGVSVRMLLNQTSGIVDHHEILFTAREDIEKYRYTTFDPRELARLGLAAPPKTPPGVWSYSNTNYILAGLILEAVTGRRAEEEITRRILRPLGLRQTYFPGTSTRIRGPHSKGYVPWFGGVWRDFSVYNQSWAWVAGSLISTMGEVNRFFRALLGGQLLRPAELAQMRETVPIDPKEPDGAHYGLGLVRAPLPCGFAWGHDGSVWGHQANSMHSADGRRQVTYALNASNYMPQNQPTPIETAAAKFVATALCGPQQAKARALHLPRVS